MYICIYWRYSIFEGDLGGHVKQTPAERHQVRSGPAPPLPLLHCLTALCEVWLKSRPRGGATCLTLKYLGAINYTKASLSNYHHEYSNTKTIININHYCHYVYFFYYQSKQVLLLQVRLHQSTILQIPTIGNRITHTFHTIKCQCRNEYQPLQVRHSIP